MKLFTKAILNALPQLYANDGKKPEDVKVPLKLFNPSGAGTWYITEYSPETNEGYGLCDLGYGGEMGYVSISELQALRLPFGMGIERDISWDMNTKLSEVKAKHPAY